MKTFAWFILCLACTLPLGAQPLKTDWAIRMGGDDLILPVDVKVQPSGHVLLAGQFTMTIDADPGPGIQWLTSAGNYDVFLTRFDPQGQYQWAKRFGGINYDDIAAMATDAEGNIFLCGRFGETVDFNPGGGVANLTSAGLSDIYLLKLNANGDFLWAKHFGGPDFDGPRALALDASGHIYLTGYFGNTADFDPGPGTFPLTSAGGADVFVLKLSPAGNPVWAKRLGGVQDAIGYAILPDAAGNVYTAGIFMGEADFDPGTTNQFRTSRGSWDIFLSKLNASGNYVWIRHIGGTGVDIPQNMHFGQDGNLVLTGYFDDTLDIDPGNNEQLLSPLGDNDGFVLKMNPQGQLVWARQLSGEQRVISERCAILPDQGILVTGRFNGALLLDPDTLAFPPIVSAGGQDIFWARYDAGGQPLWVASIGGVNNDGGGSNFALATDAEGKIYTSAWVRWAIDFDPGPDELILPESDAFELFLSRMQEVPVGMMPAAGIIPVQVWPNPGSGPLFLDYRQGTQNASFRILDVGEGSRWKAVFYPAPFKPWNCPWARASGFCTWSMIRDGNKSSGSFAQRAESWSGSSWGADGCSPRKRMFRCRP
jgi:hypothetical protein